MNADWTFDQAKSFFANILDYDISDLEGKSILAVGSGTGAIHGVDMECRAIGLDPMYGDIGASLDSSVTLVVGAGEMIPFQQGTFDVVISHNVLDHVLNPIEVLEEINRVLDSDGTFLFTVNVFKLPRVVRDALNPIDKPHPHHFSPDEVRDLMRAAGFSIEMDDIREVPIQNMNLKALVAMNFFRLKRIHLRLTPSETS
ncbi:methyltransferase domain-containing protein [Halobacterium salinarum]|uniref:class I SAM-dependent methyltransferase n=1 Tax=Halobacterium salinarum TaxID=2242 RepID=UPI002553B81D|nr:methyltransferase domain-containing protein [Halobacterium salinarum]MDL0131512.1 methyltransferase domain-containing protein [Halobacterium salinarum]